MTLDSGPTTTTGLAWAPEVGQLTLAALLETAQPALLAVGPGGRIALVSQALLSLFGSPDAPHEVTGARLDDWASQPPLTAARALWTDPGASPHQFTLPSGRTA